MANKGTLKVDQPTAILYPSEEKETRMAIRREDWNRITRLSKSIRPEPKFLRTAYSASFGAAITAGAALISIYYTPEKPPLLLPLLPMFFWFTVFALVLGIILLLVDMHNTTSKSTDIESLRQDMQEIEDTFKRETGEEIKDERIDKSISASKSVSASKAIPVAKSISASVSSPLSVFTKFKNRRHQKLKSPHQSHVK